MVTEVIILCFILLCFILIVLGPFLVTLFIARLDNLNIEKAVIEQLVNENRGYQSVLDPIPVNYSSESYFSQPMAPWADRMHLLNYEAAGALFITRDEVIFVGSALRSHKSIQIHFDLINTTLGWAGRKRRKGIVYAQLSWLEISQNSKRHYFTSQLGISCIGSKAKTSELFQKLKHICESSQESH